MTRPEQPRPYPGDAAPATAAPTPVGATPALVEPTPFPGEVHPQPSPMGLALTPKPLGVHPYRREYRDPLGRPYTGRVTITGTGEQRVGLPVDLVDGAINVVLPPDTYRLFAQLRTEDGERLVQVNDVTLPLEDPTDA